MNSTMNGTSQEGTELEKGEAREMNKDRKIYKNRIGK